jgi:1-acyl-sn-glycerol-3-phosphate acyltransferase
MILANAALWIGVAILLLIFAGIAWWVVKWLRSELTFKQSLIWSVNYTIAKVMWRTKLENELPVQSGQGAVIVANHRSGIDPSFIQLAVRRVVYWMVAREYVQAKFIGSVLRVLQVIPVGRAGVDTAAMKQAIRIAQEGGLIGMFPEGRINETKDQLFLPGRPGAALVALRARVPIIPVYIEGAPYDGTPTGSLKMRANVRVRFGQPIDLSPYYGREREEGVTQEITKQAMREMAKLAGHPEFEPQLAGRRWKTTNGDVDIENGNGQDDPKTAGAA